MIIINFRFLSVRWKLYHEKTKRMQFSVIDQFFLSYNDNIYFF